MNPTRFFQDIQHLNYVVQRNWDNLPDSFIVGEHEDLDLFVSEGDKEELLRILETYPNIKAVTDVRSLSDNYYPERIANLLLFESVKHYEVSVPNPLAHFISLYYHNAVHKKGNPYGKKLKELFLKSFEPVRCVDKGVGYYV